MRPETEIKERIAQLENVECPSCKTPGPCMDFGHGLRGTEIRILEWVLNKQGARDENSRLLQS